MLVMILSSAMLWDYSVFYQVLLGLQILALFIPLFDELLKKLNIHNSLLRFISHFYIMNLALLVGLIRFIFGVKSNVWKPTERFQ